MKKEKGITLTALILYIVIFSFTITILASLSSYIYSNMNEINNGKRKTN